MKKIQIFLNEAEFSIQAERYVYAAKCFNYVAKLFLDNNNPEMASKCLIKGAEINQFIKNYYDAGEMYLRAAILSEQHIHFVNDARSCFYNALTNLAIHDNYFKTALCIKYISTCYKLLNQEKNAENHLKLAAELFVKSGMNYLKLKEYDKAVLSFEYAIMCYENLGLDLQSMEIKNKIHAYKKDLLVTKVQPTATDSTLVSERISTKKVQPTTSDNPFDLSSANIFFPGKFLRF